MAQISIIKKSDISEARRFDAEYFKPEYLYTLNLLNRIDTKPLNYFIKDGYRVVYENTEILTNEVSKKSKTVNFLQASDLLGYYLKDELGKVKYADWERYPKGRIRVGEVLIEVKGNTEKVAIVPENFNQNTLISGTLYKFLPKNISGEFLLIWLTTKYGKGLKDRLRRNVAVHFIGKDDLYNIPVPILPQSFQLQIEKTVKTAHQKQTQSKQLYKEAEQLLLKELGLVNYQPKQQLFFETTKKEIDEAKRFDAEYFQPKYAEIIKKIENYEGGFDVVKNQFKQNKTLSKKDKEFYNYIEISDVNISNGEIIANKIDIKDIPANGKRKLFKNDLLISKVRPYRGAISFIDFEKENLLGSGAFTVLQEKTEYKKEVLMIFLRTSFIKELLLRYNCGTSYPVIKDEDILNLKIPLIKPQIQTQIADKIKESHKLRKESKELLEKAKRKVEEEIEKE